MQKQRLIFEKQQAVEFERTRIATDMHDDLGAGLSRIKFLSENIDIKIKREQPVTDDISKIKEYASEMISNMGEIIWALNRGNDSLSDLLSYVRAYAAEYLMDNGIVCTIKAPDEFPSRFVSGDFRRNIFLAVKEALHNVVKHSGANHVTIEISVTGMLSIVIADNGKGIDAGMKRPHSNGIINMGRRMKEIGGSMGIRHERGTTITLATPLPL
jgi:signal transduction histidine kinase